MSIRWPSGREQVVTALKAGGRYMITEGSETVRSLPRPQWTPSQSPVPIRAPTLDLLVNDEHGESVALGETGRPTLVNLWAPWCVPCGQEAPQLQAFAAENASWIQVVGVSVERDTYRRTRSSFGDMASHIPIESPQRPSWNPSLLGAMCPCRPPYSSMHPASSFDATVVP